MFIAFDVGETLIEYEGLALDWSEYYRPALHHALSGVGATANEDALSLACEILTFYNTRKNPRTFEVEAGEVTAKIAKLFAVSPSEFERHFFSYFRRRTRPMTSAFQLLGQLRNAGAYLAAFSDVPYGMPTSMLIEDLGELAGAFDCIASSCDVGTRKPDSKGLRQLLRASECSGNRAYYVGNERKDMEAALSAGMQGILLSSKLSFPDYGQTQSVRSLAEVAKIVLDRANPTDMA